MTVVPQALLARVLVPRASSTRDITALETAMLSLSLDERHPIALEIAGTPTSREWLLRATTPAALRHLTAQIQARYPQADITPLEEDPFALRLGEAASVVELRQGAASYLPLRTLSERELLKEGADPLLGVLAAFQHLPAGTRALVQLALVPLPATWSQAFRRRAVEHPLEPERLRHQQALRQDASTPQPAKVIGLCILVAMLVFWWRFQNAILAHTPAWVLTAGSDGLHGKGLHLTAGEMAQLIGASIGFVVLVFALVAGLLLLKKRFFQTPIYDMRLVNEKTGRVAYRVCLRLIVISTPDPRYALHAPLPLLKRVCGGRHQSPRLLWKGIQASWREQRQYRQMRWGTIDLPHQEVLDVLAAAYRQYHTASGGSFVPRRLSRSRVHHLWQERRQQPGWTRGLVRSPHLLSVADLAALWHLPQAQDLADLPYVSRGRARTLLVPPELTTGQGYQLGRSIHAGQTAPVFLPGECLRHNLLAVASTGKGKSTLFHHLALAAMQEAGRGLVVIEPHGDLIARLAGCIPDSRQDQVVMLDLAQGAFPVGINPLDMALGRDRDKAVDNLIQIVEALWSQSYGSRTENVLEYAAKTLAEANVSLIQVDPQQGPNSQYTLLDIVPLLRRTSFRHAVLEQVKDDVLLEWWQTYYEPLDLRMQAEVTSSVVTKLSKFASSRLARRILGQSQTSINLQEIIRQGNILLVSTASGVVGADISAFLGATLLGLLQTTLAEQASLQPEQRRPMLMLIDEFQVYNGVNYQTMLAELRKYGGSFGLATQSLSYLDRFDQSLRATVLANIDHLFAFTMAAEDAHLLRLDGVEEADLTSLDDYQCYTRLSVAGRRLPLFSLHLDLSSAGNAEQARTIVQQSQQRYAHPVGMVDTALHEAIVRQRTAVPTFPTFPEAITPTTTGPDNGLPSAPGSSSTTTPRKKRRGRGGKGRDETSPAGGPVTQQVHLMYHNEAGKEHQDANAPTK